MYNMELKNFQKIKDERVRQSMARIARRQCTLAVPAAMVVALFWTFAVPMMQMSTRLPMEAPPPVREYESNGYLMISPNGGLNQMRAGICDMVAVARYINATLVLPHLDNTSFWQDQSRFDDIFQVDHFINSLRDEVKIVKHLPPDMQTKLEMGKLVSMPPISWSNISYYTNEILPEKLKKNEILHFEKTDCRLANNGPLELQKLRCKVNYRALKFSRKIEKMGTKIVNILRKRGKFLVLHLRYEKDMLAYTGCPDGCTSQESQELQNLRYSIPWWKQKTINSTSSRLDGLCPLTPEETALTLKALGINRETQIYIAAGDVYGGERRLAALRSAYPNLVTKETLLQASDLLQFKNYASQMAAIDYIVSLESDIFFPTYGGNMARLVEGHRRYMGFRKTIQPNQKALVDLIDKYRRNWKWEEFELGVKKAHNNRYGNPAKRTVIPDKPREEDYFWSNPHECLPSTQDNFKL